MSTAKFDPKKQWDSAAAAWHRWAPLLNRWLGTATEDMLNMANIQLGSHVLDVAAGAGEQSITVARRIGSSGRILATDISSDILEFAQYSAKLEGINNLETKVLHGECIDSLEKNSFDAVISRVGLIYFPDQQRALKGMKSCLKPGGKISVMTYAAADRNGFFSIPVSIIRRRAQLPPSLPGQPGPFSLGDPKVLKKVLEQAGFKHVEVKSINSPLRLSSCLECIQFEQESFGALHQMLSGLSSSAQDQAWEEIEQELRKFETDGQFNGPCEMLVASGVK